MWGLGDGSIYRVLALQAEVPEFSLQHSCKNSGVKVCDYNSCTREIEAGGSVGLAGQFWQIRKLQVLWLTLSQKTKVHIDQGSHLKLTFVLHTQTHSSTFTHMHTHKQVHIHTYAQRNIQAHIYSPIHTDTNGKQMNESLLSSFH